MASKSILIISSYTVSKFMRFLRHSVLTRDSEFQPQYLEIRWGIVSAINNTAITGNITHQMQWSRDLERSMSRPGCLKNSTYMIYPAVMLQIPRSTKRILLTVSTIY